MLYIALDIMDLKYVEHMGLSSLELLSLGAAGWNVVLRGVGLPAIRLQPSPHCFFSLFLNVKMA